MFLPQVADWSGNLYTDRRSASESHVALSTVVMYMYIALCTVLMVALCTVVMYMYIALCTVLMVALCTVVMYIHRRYVYEVM